MAELFDSLLPDPFYAPIRSISLHYEADRKQKVMSCQSDVTVDQNGTDIPVKFGDFRSNRSRDIRGAHFVMDERTTNGG